MLFPLILILNEEKNKNFFYNNWGIRALVIHFYCMLIDLINDYKKTFILVVMFVLGFLRWFL